MFREIQQHNTWKWAGAPAGAPPPLKFGKMTSCTAVLQNTLNFSLAPLVLAIEAPLEKNLRAPMKVGIHFRWSTNTCYIRIFTKSCVLSASTLLWLSRMCLSLKQNKTTYVLERNTSVTRKFSRDGTIFSQKTFLVVHSKTAFFFQFSALWYSRGKKVTCLCWLHYVSFNWQHY